MENKKSMIWGATGQDASYLAELLLERGHEVYGVKRRASTNNTQNISHLLNSKHFHLMEGDITDQGSVNHLVSLIKPDYLFNVAAMSHVFTSFEQPTYTFHADALGQLYVLDAVRLYSPKTHIQFASTSECFGSNYSTRPMWKSIMGENGQSKMVPDGEEKYQDENTPFSPNSPYAVAKCAATNLTKLYRTAYGLHASNCITHNHESPRRGENFVTRKITLWIAKHFPLDKCTEKLKLGNIEAFRDWSYAKDCVEAFIKVVEADEPDDYTIGTGESHTVKEFLEEAFSLVNANYKDYVEIDSAFYRPCEVPYLRCDASKIKHKLGWEPTVKFKELVAMMVEHDLNGKKN
jgi:GDPmannose 4,6-dehydratase